MIIDSHTHAWEAWPYRPPVPDPESRGRVEQLLWEMDACGVDRAVLVCARIDHNPGNNEYVHNCIRKYPDRLVQFADVDCSWTETYHTPGGAGRLAEAAKRHELKGFTHYLKDDHGWFTSEDGIDFFDTAARLGLIASLALSPEWQPSLRELARRFPSVPFLCHHMAGARVGEAGPRESLEEILRSAEVPNILIKLSGFHYASRVSWDYPYPDTREIVRRLYREYGPDRLCWGSDYPVVRVQMTYRQSLEAFRTHCDFVSPADQAKILGRNLQRLLENAGA
jgi:L-fuconolactonase